MRSRWIYLYILVIFVLSGAYLFHKGMEFGVYKYKHSRNFEMTLDSAYRYGLHDCRKGNTEDNI